MTLTVDSPTQSDEAEGEPHALARRSPLMIAEQGVRAGVRTWLHFVGNFTGHHSRRFEDFHPAGVQRNLWHTAHAAADELITLFFSFSTQGLSTEEFERVEFEVRQLESSLEAAGAFEDPRVLHPTPSAPEQVFIDPSHFRNFDGEWVTFDSGWVPGLLAPGIEGWQEHRQNHVVHAGLFRHADGPRPWLVMVHGAEMGRPNLDARLLKARHLHETLGVNVVMPVLPMHGPRRAEVPTMRGTFPGLDLVGNLYGVTQGVWDVRRTLAWVRTQDPTAIGLFGFSLGGLVSGVVAGFEDDLDAVVLGCPAVDLTALFVSNLPPLGRSHDRVMDMFERAGRMQMTASPIQFEPAVDVDRLALISAYADRMADPVDQVGLLWEHWGRPEIRLVDTGHVTYFLNSEGPDALVELLTDRGVVSAEGAQGG